MVGDVSCPTCGGQDIRLARSSGFTERLLELAGVYPLRCKQCQTRFRTRVWRASNMIYARCPRCFRMQLSTWSEQYYNPAFTIKAKLRFGATPYRCEICRCNFASFRACKERYLWRNLASRQASVNKQNAAK